MLRSTNTLINYVLEATDGELGRCKDFLFDDSSWVIRYMVADTHKWLPGRKVLISPISLRQPDWNTKRFPVDLTRQQVEDSPPLSEAAPVSRREEERWATHYGYGAYWVGAYIWGGVPYPHELRGSTLPSMELEEESAKVHVRSTQEVTGYYVLTRTGQLGRISDFVLDDVDWRVSHFVCELDFGGGEPAAKENLRAIIPIDPKLVSSVDWLKGVVVIDAAREDLCRPTNETTRPPSLSQRESSPPQT